MFELEEAIARWRESMSKAGIGPGEVRDELESHLREKHSEIVRAGNPETEAFLLASAALGTGARLQREYSRAGSRVKLKSPLHLRLCAWSTLLAAAIYYPKLGAAYNGGWTFSVTTLNLDGSYEYIFVPSVFYFIALLCGSLASLYYLIRPGWNSGKLMVIYVSAVLCWFGYRVLEHIPFLQAQYPVQLSIAYERPAVQSGIPLFFHSISPWPLAVATTLAGGVCLLWLNRLHRSINSVRGDV